MNRKHFFHKLFLTLLVLTITPVIFVSIFNLHNSRRLLEHEIHNTNNLLLHRIEENVSANLAGIKKDLATFVLNSPELAYLQAVRAYEPADSFMMMKLVEEMSELKKKHEYIDDVVVKVKNIPLFLTTDGSYYAEYFVDSLSNRDFTRLLAESQNYSFDFLLGYSKSEASRYDAVVLSYSMPVGQQDYSVLLSVIINTQRLAETIRAIGLTREGFITVTDASGKPIAAYSHNPMESDVQRTIAESARQRSAGATIVVNEGKYVFTSTVSALNGWRYNAFIPMQEIAARTESIKTFAYSAIALFALVGLLIAYIGSKRLYRPMNKLLDFFTDRDAAVTDEFSFLQDHIRDVLLESEALQNRFLSVIPQLQDKFLLDLLHNRIRPEQIDDKIKQLHIRFAHNPFRVVIAIAKPGAREETAELADRLRSCCGNDRMLREDDRLIMLFHHDEFELAGLKRACGALPAALGIGEAYGSRRDIGQSYAEAAMCLEYRTLGDTFESIAYADLSRVYNLRMLYPPEFEQRIANCLESRDYEGAEQQMGQVVERYFHENMPLCCMQANMDRLFSFLNRMCVSLQREMPDVFGAPPDYRGLRGEPRDVAEFHGRIGQWFAALVAYAREDEAGASLPVIRQIQLYIEEHLAHDLSLEMIADRFDISYNYLSLMIKETLGVGYVDYVTGLRIRRSKELLQEEALKIKEVAEQVGYANVLTFNRNFKKLEAITPNQYRAKIAQQGPKPAVSVNSDRTLKK